MTNQIDGRGYTIYHGDARAVLDAMPADHYTAALCDPPYGLGEDPNASDVLKSWLSGDDYTLRAGGYLGHGWDQLPGPNLWRAIFRVLAPGAILFAFGGTRTADLLSVAIRMAGFCRFDEITYLYSSGFPKSVRIANGASAQVDREWAGYGTALCPAHEPILCFRKPRNGTYAETAHRYGSGALNIDDCRIVDGTDRRWPKNVLLDATEAARLDSGYDPGTKPSARFQTLPTFIYDSKAHSTERDEGLLDLPAQRGGSETFDPRARSGTGAGRLPIRRNTHPTVKPISLTSALAKLLLPPASYRSAARLLVPFAGSGSEMIGGLMAGWENVDGIELCPQPDQEIGTDNPDYISILIHRLDHWRSELSTDPRRLRGRAHDGDSLPLFAGN